MLNIWCNNNTAHYRLKKTFSPSVAVSLISRTASSAAAPRKRSPAPEIISILCGIYAVTALENIDSATIVSTGVVLLASSIPAQISISVAIECLTNANYYELVKAQLAEITSRVCANKRAVVHPIAVTSPDIGIGLRPCP